MRQILLPTKPLRAMLGCLGTAPARKEAATSTPGPFGGNMDYAGLNAGVKVTLPVNEPGALLFLGDGHARQGEGEVVGTGVETSMDVEFTVDLVKKKTIGWPRLENDTYIMVLGSERPLLQAFQHATTDMHRWLVTDYKHPRAWRVPADGPGDRARDRQRCRPALHRRRQASQVAPAALAGSLRLRGLTANRLTVRWWSRSDPAPPLKASGRSSRSTGPARARACR